MTKSRHLRGCSFGRKNSNEMSLSTLANSLIRGFGLAFTKDEWDQAVTMLSSGGKLVASGNGREIPSQVLAVAEGCRESVYLFPTAHKSLLQTFQSLSDPDRGRFITVLCQSLFPFVDGTSHKHAVYMTDSRDSDEIFRIQPHRNLTLSGSLHYLALLTLMNEVFISPIENKGDYKINLDYQNIFLIQLYKTLPYLPLIPIGFQSAIEEALMCVNHSTVEHLESSLFVALQATSAIEQVVLSPYKQTEIQGHSDTQGWDPYLVKYLAEHIVEIACGRWGATNIEWTVIDETTGIQREENGEFHFYCDTLLGALENRLSKISSEKEAKQGGVPVDLRQRLNLTHSIIHGARDKLELSPIPPRHTPFSNGRGRLRLIV